MHAEGETFLFEQIEPNMASSFDINVTSLYVTRK
jgi:hypothetical protein